MKSVSSRPRGAGGPDRILITGAGGMLGSALGVEATGRGCEVMALTRAELDITDEAAVGGACAAFARAPRSAVGSYRAAKGHDRRALALVLNAAAYTDVEGAEDDSARAYAVNERGAGLLAGSARAIGLDFVHISTDFVFDGEKLGPYTEDYSPAPLNVYGASKLAGERAVLAAERDALIIRTAWVFGPPGPNFPLKMVDLARRHESLQVVEDETGAPTYAVDLARGILDLATAGARGLFHLTASGSCSRVELARETLRLMGIDAVIRPVPSSLFASKARRPKNSVLDCAKAAEAGVRLPEWRDGLARYLRGN